MPRRPVSSHVADMPQSRNSRRAIRPRIAPITVFALCIEMRWSYRIIPATGIPADSHELFALSMICSKLRHCTYPSTEHNSRALQHSTPSYRQTMDSNCSNNSFISSVFIPPTPLFPHNSFGKHLTLSGQQPFGRYVIIPDKIDQPSQLYAVLRRLVSFERIHIPSVYTVSSRECLLSTYDTQIFQGIQNLKKPFRYLCTLLCLHNISD